MATTQVTPNDEGPRSFARFIEGIGEGDLVREASDMLHELTAKIHDEALARQDKVGGQFKLTIKIVCDPRGNVGLAYDVDITKPKPKRVPGIGWMTKGSNVTFVHPRQLTMPLREVVTSGEEIDIDTGEITPAREV